ncbi:MAG: HupE/UreJ family protein [Chromatiaceae bacterium]|jgi:urease accessory protein|nr:HupE/UreJ family protein [Chromatiaceae bacterium]
MSRLCPAPLILTLLLAAGAASGHIEGGHVGDGGLLTGLYHPISGLDHVVAMVAVGLWGAQLGVPAIWLLPVAFPLVMALGGLAGVTGLPLPGIEVGIALSGVVLGLLVALAARPPLSVALLLIAAFAILHGHAHGTELPVYGVPILYAAGFVIATGLLHVSGILIGLTHGWPWGSGLVRAGGAVVLVIGAYYLLQAAGLA